jgi:hypothetical protein
MRRSPRHRLFSFFWNIWHVAGFWRKNGRRDWAFSCYSTSEKLALLLSYTPFCCHGDRWPPEGRHWRWTVAFCDWLETGWRYRYPEKEA